MTTTKDKLMAVLNEKQQSLDLTRAMLEELSEPLSAITLDAVLMGASQLDFDNLSHHDVIKVIKAFGGKWQKTPSHDDARIDYSTNCGDYSIRCWHGEPPPNCRIVEEEVIVPAVPEHKAKVRRLVCTETINAESIP